MGDNLNGIFANMIQGMGFIGCAPNRVYNMAPPNGGGVEATAEGTELTLHSAAAPLTALTLYGKSEQRTTTGAQLAYFQDAEPYVSKGITWSCKNGIVTANGTVEGRDSSSSNEKIKFDLPVIPGDYFVSGNAGGVVVYTAVRKADNSVTYYTNKMFSLDGTEKSVMMYAQINGEGTTVSNVVVYPMLNAGSTALPWEPYTGGAPSPSPDYPQEIKSVGDSGTVNVTLSDGGSQSQTLPVQTPNGLPGIPVSSGGNYTDANGQQWICDEVDFKRGVYIEKKYHTHYSYNEITYVDGRPYNIFTYRNSDFDVIEANGHIMLEVGKYVPEYGQNNSYRSVIAGLRGRVDEIKSQEDISKVFPDGIDVLFLRSTPIETPLSPSELAAYAALRTYSPTTVVSNDAGAWMKVGYKATPQPMTMLARKR